MRGSRSVASRRRRLAAGMVAMAMILAACGTSQTSSTSSGAATGQTTASASAAEGAAGLAPCRGAQLAASYGGTQGASGHMEVTLTLRNVSRTPCRLQGYPGARLLNSAGRALPMHVRHGRGFFPDTLRAPGAVALRPDGRARFGISFATNNEYAHAHVCHTAVAAMAAAPGAGGRWERVSLRAAPRISPCGDLLVLSPVHA